MEYFSPHLTRSVVEKAERLRDNNSVKNYLKALNWKQNNNV